MAVASADRCTLVPRSEVVIRPLLSIRIIVPSSVMKKMSSSVIIAIALDILIRLVGGFMTTLQCKRNGLVA